MSDIKNRFETSDVKTRKRHQVVLTVNSPKSSEKTFANKEMELSVSHVVHVTPSEKALEIKAQREREKEQEIVEKLQAAVQDEVVYEEAFENKASEVEPDVAEVKEETLVEETLPEAATEEVAPVEVEATVSAPIEAEETPVVEEITEDVSVQEEIAPGEELPLVASEETQVESEPIVVNNYSGEATSTRSKSRFRLSLTQKKALSGWFFVLPFIIGILFIYAPIVIDSIAISLSDIELYPGEMGLTWNNFGNYAYLFAEDGDPYFSITIVDGIKDLLLQIPAIVIFALFMAIILNQKMTGRAAFRAIFFLPVILSTGIIDTIDTNSAFMEAISNSQGGVDDNTGAEASGGIISAMDLESLLGGIKIGTELVDYVVSLVNGIFDIVSRSGVQMLIFLSGLQSISPSIYESCEVEGASAWETFWKITLPMISPMILVNAIYTVIDAFTAADNRVMIYIKKIYDQAGAGYARSSAMSWIYVGVVLLFIVLVALIMKTVVFYQKRD